MTERLWRIAQLLSTARDLFGKHAQMIRKAEHILKQIHSLDAVPRLVNAGPDHGLDEPKGTHAKRPFSAAYTCNLGTNRSVYAIL